MPPSLQEIAHQALDMARNCGADAADAQVMQGTSLSIDVRGGALEQAERAEDVDIALRVLVGRRQASVSASDMRPETLRMLAERAVMMARAAPEDPHAGLADPSQLASAVDMSMLELSDPAPEPAPEELQDDAARAEAAALAVAGVSQVQAASAGYTNRAVHQAASNGFSAGFSRTDRGCSCVAIAGSGTGMERDYDSDARIFQGDLRPPEEIGATAGARTVARLGARKPPTGSYPVLFDERISASLIGHLLMATNGAAIARGASWLLGREGAEVLPRGLSLLEDPHRPRAMASRVFDAEGLPTQTRALVEDGVLTGWTLDLATARKLGLSSTGNAKRGSGSPSPGNWNVALTQGTLGRDDLLREMGTGLWVTGLIGSTINPNTGDYSRGASGFWVAGGEVQYPVSECTIAGSLPQMLRALTPANDARAHLSRVVPSVLVEGMTLAGA